MEDRITIRIEHNGRGAWEVSTPEEGRTIVCETLDDARRAAFLATARARLLSELIVHDAYHRVLQHELIRPPERYRPQAKARHGKPLSGPRRRSPRSTSSGARTP